MWAIFLNVKYFKKNRKEKDCFPYCKSRDGLVSAFPLCPRAVSPKLILFPEDTSTMQPRPSMEETSIKDAWDEVILNVPSLSLSGPG